MHLFGMSQPKTKGCGRWKRQWYLRETLRRQVTVSVTSLASRFLQHDTIEPFTRGFVRYTVNTDATYHGLFSRDASVSTIQSMLVSPARTAYQLDSGMRHVPEHDPALSAIFSTAPAPADIVLSAFGRPTRPSSLLGGSRVPPSEAELHHVQYLHARALYRVQHQRQMIASLRATMLSPSASANGLVASISQSSVDRNSSPDTCAIGKQGRPLHLSARLASLEISSSNAILMDLPVIFAQSTDTLVLTGHQALLRQQIELFRATQGDLLSPARGRNKRIEVGQVGIRCRHCAHVLAARRTKGSVYFPATLLGLYQAAQNMSSNHIQCGLCPEMPQSLKDKFTELFPTKVQSSGVGRAYWAESAKKLGMIDTDQGIRFVRDI
jgi:hypothetical protein